MGSLVSLLWVDVFYNLFLLLGVTLAVSTDAVHSYRLAVSIFFIFFRTVFLFVHPRKKKTTVEMKPVINVTYVCFVVVANMNRLWLTLQDRSR